MLLQESVIELQGIISQCIADSLAKCGQIRLLLARWNVEKLRVQLVPYWIPIPIIYQQQKNPPIQKG